MAERIIRLSTTFRRKAGKNGDYRSRAAQFGFHLGQSILGPYRFLNASENLT